MQTAATGIKSGIIFHSSEQANKGSAMSIKISQHFDSGAIEVVRAESAKQIDLNLRSDNNADIH